jgi:O-antigen/teichoic acid export membrane protein
LRLTPALAGANVGYLMMNHTDIPLVATFFGPQAAAVYALTRKAAEALRGLLDTVGFAAYGGFAHLVASADRGRSRGVVSEVVSLRWSAAAVAMACYVALNEPFVDLVFGSESFAGLGLTVAFALLVVVGGQSFLLNYLYRAAGAVRSGSLLLLQESLVRVFAMALGLWLFGLAGGPALAAFVSLVYAWINWRRLLGLIPRRVELARGWRRWSISALVLAVGVAAGVVGVPPSWPAIAATGVVLAAAGLTSMAAADPLLRVVVQRGWPAWFR